MVSEIELGAYDTINITINISLEAFISLYLLGYAAGTVCLLPEAISLHERMVALLCLTLALFWHIFATNNSAQCEDISFPKKIFTISQQITMK